MKPIFTECGCEFEKGGWITDTCEHGREFVQVGAVWSIREITQRPTVVCLCGSTRFCKEFQQANLSETLKGNIVLTIGCDMKSDNDLFSELNELKTKLDELHFRKIDLADEVLILNVDGYIGESTSRELAYAKGLGKNVRFLENPKRKDRTMRQGMERINEQWVYIEETREAASDQFGCTCDSCCAGVADHPDRVTQTIDRLISNLPQVIEILREANHTSLMRHLIIDLDNLIYWQKRGGLVEIEPDRCDCSQTIPQAHGKTSD